MHPYISMVTYIQQL